MADQVSNETVKAGSNNLVRFGILAVLLLVAFLVGLIPQAMQKWEVQEELAVSQKHLRQAEIKGLLTTAIVEAKRGEYEPARQDTSNFFTRLDVEQKAAETERFLKTDEIPKLASIFAERDAIITMLAQRDPASVDRLTNVYINYLQATGVPRSATPVSASPETPAANSNQ